MTSTLLQYEADKEEFIPTIQEFIDSIVQAQIPLDTYQEIMNDKQNGVPSIRMEFWSPNAY